MIFIINKHCHEVCDKNVCKDNIINEVWGGQFSIENEPDKQKCVSNVSWKAQSKWNVDSLKIESLNISETTKEHECDHGKNVTEVLEITRTVCKVVWLLPASRSRLIGQTNPVPYGQVLLLPSDLHEHNKWDKVEEKSHDF